MTEFLDIFGFLSVLLRGLALAFEALAVGGLIFLFAVAGRLAGSAVINRIIQWIACTSILLALTQGCVVAANSLILRGSTDLTFGEIVGAGFWLSGALSVTGSVAILVFVWSRWLPIVSPFAVASIMAGSVMMSHSVARVELTWLAIACTVLHHLASAAWIGGLPYLLVAMQRTDDGAIVTVMIARFSRLAMASVTLLLAAGAGLAWLYVGSATAMVETTYGVMLLAKMMLTAIVLLLGFLNRGIVRVIVRGVQASLPRLKRFAEVEVGIGFTVLLAAASLTSAPPAIDVVTDRVPMHEIVQRMEPRFQHFETPPLTQISPATPLVLESSAAMPGSFVPGQRRQPNTPADIAWSEYNHHWAGLVVFAAGILALLSRRVSWASYWPFAFLGLAAFLFIRADSENWPLGPRGFWESFQVAEVAQHRLFVLLIVAFAVFEWAVQTRRLSPHRAGLVFPFVCAAGGALLLTHSHSLGNVKEEFLAELSHIPIAILGIIAGWSRWLEIRLPGHNERFVVAWIWPVSFVLIGTILALYRES